MNKVLIYMVGIGLLTGCYDDKGGNDFDTSMADVEINLQETAYSASLGETITIEPTIKTDIPDSDLQYLWEVTSDNQFNEFGRKTYVPLVEDSEQGKVLNFVCKLGESITSLNTAYTCRLHARQVSTGRDFYSSEAFTITIAGITGLLVLHGDDSSSDVGVLEAEEFTPSSNSLPTSPKATPYLYSMNNGGSKIAGKGETIVQSISSFLNSTEQKKRCRIYIKTSEEVLFANMADLSFYGDWNKLFYLTGDRKVNDGNPRGYLIDGQIVSAFDGEDFFMMQQSNQYPFLFPHLTPATECGDGHTFVLAPHLLRVATGGIQCLGYSDKVDGTVQKGFLSIQQLNVQNMYSYTKLLDTKSDVVKFNPGNMQADLVVMRKDSRAHAMAVLKGDASHPQYAGRYFAVDINPNAAASGESGVANAPQYIYDMSSLAEVESAIAFELGESKNMCYYATPSTVYQFGVDGSVIYAANKLNMANGSALDITGEITMMKLLDSPNVTTRNTEPILLVATWDGSRSVLYALHISTAAGKVMTAVKYDQTTVSGWNFGRIADVNIKGL